MKHFLLSVIAVAILFVGCTNDTVGDGSGDLVINDGVTTLKISLPKQVRTTLGEKNPNGGYPVYWNENDQLRANGITSQKITINEDNPSTAQFEFKGLLKYPLVLTHEYPTDAAQGIIYFLPEQSYIEGSYTQYSTPMCGYVAKSGDKIELKHLATMLRFAVKASEENTTLDKIVISSATANIAGDFELDCQNATISPTENASNTITYTANTSLSTTTDKVFYIALPVVEAGRCTVKFIDSEGNTMEATWNATNLKAGVIREFSSLSYKPNTKIDLSLFDKFNIEYDNMHGIVPCCGFVKDASGNPLSNVVVSDGLVCTTTNDTGYYEMDIEVDDTKFVFISIPSGYKVQNNSNGIPQFYYTVTEEDRAQGYCVANFELEAIANPNRYTLIVGADPQPRARTAGDDRVAFHSLDICEDLYRDMRETRAAITDREVYGMMLGDIVHENMSLYAYYVAGLSTLNFQMFNIIGNHDHDLSATTDVEGARRFEENFGPSYYSFNIGKQHYIVLDNIIMTVVDGKLKKNEYTYGLTDRQWQWLQNDLSYVDKSTTLMVASHCPMFKKDSAKAEFWEQSTHGADYANLLKQYNKVHAWAGHTHRSFNYNYPSSNTLKNIEVHTLARSTGEFWTNEWNAYGTPRGYTIVEVDGDNISWKFKPTIYQAAFIGNNYSTVGTPSYTYRDWNYNEDGVAIMKDSGKILDSSYQIKAWKAGYYVYANVFMWDDKWETPKYNGSNMSIVSRTSNEAEDYAYKELCDFYSVNSILSGYDDYDYTLPLNYHNSIFRSFTFASSGSGTITVKDRFGNEFSTTISW